MKSMFSLLTCLFLVAGVFGQEIEEISPKLSTSKTSVAQAKQAMADLYQKRIARQVPGAETTAIDLFLDGEERDRMAKKSEGSSTIGLTKVLNLPIDLEYAFAMASKKPMETGYGMVRQDKQGFVWTAALFTEDASGIRLQFSDFKLPEGVEVYVYSDLGQAFGPYTENGPNGKGEFWSDTLFSDAAWIQVEIGAGVDPAKVSFNLKNVAYLGEAFKLGRDYMDHARGKYCPGSAGLTSCFENARCYDNDGTVQKLMGAVAWIMYQSDKNGSWYGCTGALINGSGATANMPWFLTAAHCVNSSTEVDSMEAYFDYATSGCSSLTSNCSSAYNNTNKVSGGSLVATGGASLSDYSLIELPDYPNGSSWSLGWNSGDFSDNDGETLYRVSHPNHYPQAYSEHEVGTSLSQCSGDSRPAYIYTLHTLGYTEGGSSGAPLVNSTGKIVGKDKGRCSDQTCNDTLPMRDGSFRTAYYDKLRPFLKPTDIHVEEITVTEESVGGILYRPEVKVKVVDNQGVPVSGALVQMNLSGPFAMPAIGVTGSDGWATAIGFPVPASGTWTACTLSITHTWLTWDSSEDDESCDSN